jgi:predicted RNase H-like nuclease
MWNSLGDIKTGYIIIPIPDTPDTKDEQDEQRVEN